MPPALVGTLMTKVGSLVLGRVLLVTVVPVVVASRVCVLLSVVRWGPQPRQTPLNLATGSAFPIARETL